LHYVRDVTLGEDACQVRKGSAPQVLAALRNAALHLLVAVPAESRAAATERLAARPDEALNLLGRPRMNNRTALHHPPSEFWIVRSSGGKGPRQAEPGRGERAVVRHAMCVSGILPGVFASNREDVEETD
jgi:hypothetical protein